MTTKHWKRAAVALYCGYCHEIVAKGAPILEIRLKRVKKTRIRCENCAEEPVPDPLPALSESNLDHDFRARVAELFASFANDSKPHEERE